MADWRPASIFQMFAWRTIRRTFFSFGLEASLVGTVQSPGGRNMTPSLVELGVAFLVIVLVMFVPSSRADGRSVIERIAFWPFAAVTAVLLGGIFLLPRRSTHVSGYDALPPWGALIPLGAWFLLLGLRLFRKHRTSQP
jgi:hypothetical protein